MADTITDPADFMVAPLIGNIFVMINKVSLIAFTKNDIGNAFWNKIGWTEREDLNYYDFTLNEKNITAFIEED